LKIFFHEHSERTGLSLNFEVDKNLPVYLNGDPVRLRQIFLNLIGNSFKFTKTGSITIGAAVLEKKEVSVLLDFFVRDTGIGISEEQAGRLFTPFTQADASTTRKYGGTGLGLTITKKLVELMGGEISLKSVPGQGTTIKFSFSFEYADESGELEQDKAHDKVKKEKSLEGYRVLLVEDNDVNVLVARSLMKKMGLKIFVAENGQVAIDKIEEAQKEGLRPAFDIVFMDLQMPVLDGYEATKKLRANPEYADLVIVAMTAHAINEEREHCLAVGMNDHLTKPIEVAKLRETLEFHLTGNKTAS